MEYYDSIAQGYNELYGDEQRQKLQVIKQKLQVSPTDKLLDVGCGTGISSDFPCHTLGVDPSLQLIKQAKNAIWASAEDLPFPDNEFDIVISVTAIQNFSDIPKALSEIHRVAKDQVVITFLKHSSQRQTIEHCIKETFSIREIVEEQKDIIFFCNKRHATPSA